MTSDEEEFKRMMEEGEGALSPTLVDSPAVLAQEAMVQDVGDTVDRIWALLKTKRKTESLREIRRELLMPSDLRDAEILGEGATGRVVGAFYGSRHNARPVAVKQLAVSGLSSEQIEKLKKEALIHQNLLHPNITVLLGASTIEGLLVLERADTTVFDALHKRVEGDKPIAVATKLKWILDMMMGLDYLHELGIVHRDLKTSNLLVFEELATVKISDFGLAKFKTSLTMTQTRGAAAIAAGTTAYKAPELLDRREYKRNGKRWIHTTATDVYAAGIIMVEIMTEQIPFGDVDDADDVRFGVVDEDDRPAIPDGCDDDGILDVAREAWARDPRERPALKDLIDRIASLHADRVARDEAAAAADLASPRSALSPGGSVSGQEAREQRRVEELQVWLLSLVDNLVTENAHAYATRLVTGNMATVARLKQRFRAVRHMRDYNGWLRDEVPDEFDRNDILTALEGLVAADDAQEEEGEEEKASSMSSAVPDVAGQTAVFSRDTVHEPATLSRQRVEPVLPWLDEGGDAARVMVIDMGSGVTKAGFAGDDAPHTRFASALGSRTAWMASDRHAYVGHDAQTNRAWLDLQWPIARGVVQDWDALDKLLLYTIQTALRATPEEHALIMTDPVQNPHADREQMMMTAFETYGVPAFHFAMPAVALYASGRTTGTVVEIGEGVTQVVPMFDGYLPQHAVQRLDLGGGDVTHRLAQLISERGYSTAHSATAMDMVREMKEALSFVSTEFKEDLANASSSSDFDSIFELPDGKQITLGAERFRCAEVLFQPQIAGSIGIHQAVHESIMQCDRDVRVDLRRNIMVSGGTSMTDGLQARLKRELDKRSPPSCRIGVRNVSDDGSLQQDAAWIGASILGSMTAYNGIMVTKEDYDEMGPQLATRDVDGSGTAGAGVRRRYGADRPSSGSPKTLGGEGVQAVVVDLGSVNLRAGFGGNDAPSRVIDSAVGRPKYASPMTGLARYDRYVGDEAQSNRGVLDMRYPIEHGIVTNWDDLELLLDFTFHNELRVSPQEHPVLFTEAPLNPKANRERLIQIMFETFNSLGTYVVVDGICSLYASGRTTGTVVSVGGGVQSVVPIYEGGAVGRGIRRVDFGGADVQRYLARLLRRRGYSFTTVADMQAVARMAETVAFVPGDYEREMSNASMSPSEIESKFELPDGEVITLGVERLAPEAYFQPHLSGFSSPGLHSMVYESVMESDLDLRAELFKNTVVSGGASHTTGLPKRLEAELADLLPDSRPPQVISPPERADSVWIGGSILGSLCTFQQMWVSKQDYDETGPSIVHRKCWGGEASLDLHTVTKSRHAADAAAAKPLARQSAAITEVLLPDRGESKGESVAESVTYGTSDSFALVVDLGSESMRGGLAGDSAPRVTIPVLIGNPKYAGVMVGSSQKDSYCADEARHRRGDLCLRSPIQHGVVQSWDDVQQVFHQMWYNELREAPEMHPVLFTAPPFCSAKHLENMLQKLFETFNTPALFAACSTVLPLYAAGRTSGCVLDVGGGTTTVAAVTEGAQRCHPYRPRVLSRLDVGGRDLTEHLARLLTMRGYLFSTASEMDVVRDIKEKLSFVSQNFALDKASVETSSDHEQQYELPDGLTVHLARERFECMEALFEPGLLGREADGVHTLVHNTIVAAGDTVEARANLYSSLLVTGGSARCEGFSSRLISELNGLVPEGTGVAEAEIPRGEKYSSQDAVWLGGAVLASQRSLPWTSKQQYDEQGPSEIARLFMLSNSS